MFRFLLACVVAVVIIHVATFDLPTPAHSPSLKAGKMSTVIGGSPLEPSSLDSANLSLPEDAILLPTGQLIIADTQAGVIRAVENNVLKVIAGTGSMYVDPNLIPAPTADKGFPVTGLLPYADGFLSFSASGAGVNYHVGNVVSFIGNTQVIGGEELEIGRMMYAQLTQHGPVAIDGTGNRNKFFRIGLDGIEHLDVGHLFPEIDILGFSFCFDDLLIAYEESPGGEVHFDRVGSGSRERLFSDRSYSGEIQCLAADDFLFGARWELKRYTEGEITVVASDFVHVSGIRQTDQEGVFLVTDSDAETVSLVSLDGERREMVSTRNAILSDPLIKIQPLASGSLIGITPHNEIVLINPHTKELKRLHSEHGGGGWDSYLGGHKFVSLRALLLDEPNNVVYLASNHGIFTIDLTTGSFSLFAGSEVEYGSADGHRLNSRFAVIRDLALHRGVLYVADTWNDKVRAIDLKSGIVRTVAGSGTSELKTPNPEKCSPSARYNLNHPMAIEIVGETIVVANSFSHSLVKIYPGVGVTCHFAATSEPSVDQYGGGYVEGESNLGKLSGPIDLVEWEGGVIVADMWNSAVRYVDRAGTLSTIFRDVDAARMIASVGVSGGEVFFSGSDASVRSFPIVSQ